MQAFAHPAKRHDPQPVPAPGSHEVRIDASAASGRLVFLNRRHHLVAEQFRLMAGRLNTHHPNGGAFLVTSPVPADGKTFTALNMSFALAERSRVLLLELDLRRPSMKRILGLESSLGDLASVLRGTTTPETAIHTVAGTQLSIGFASESSGDVREALQGDGIRQLLAWGRKRFRWIVIDAPPVLPISDVSEIAPLTDFVTLVVRARHTPAPLLRRSIATLGHRLRYSILNDGNACVDSAYSYIRDYAITAEEA